MRTALIRVQKTSDSRTAAFVRAVRSLTLVNTAPSQLNSTELMAVRCSQRVQN